MADLVRENLREPAVDISRFWFRDKVTFSVKLGASYSNRDRTFDSRRFRFTPRGLFGFDLTAPPEELLAPENIDQNRGFELREEFAERFGEFAGEDDGRGLVPLVLLADVARLLAALRPGRDEEAVRPRPLAHGRAGHARVLRAECGGGCECEAEAEEESRHGCGVFELVLGEPGA